MRSALRGACAAFACGLLFSACIPTPPGGVPRAANVAVPGSYGGVADPASSAKLKWSEFFVDPKLDALIDTALANNQEINIVSREMDIAKSEILARRGEYLPKVNALAGAGIEKVGQLTSQGVSDDANKVAANLPNFGFGLSASWEIDIWSKLRNATRAATLRYLSTREGRKYAITHLVGEIATAYYELVALDALLDVLKQNIEIQSSALEVVRLQKEAARVTELAVKRFEAEVLKNRSRQYGVQQQIVETENRINFLVGRFPQRVDRNPQGFAALVPPVVHTGIPAELLENRPDVKQAELELEASALDVKAARAAFYPSLGISANIGYQSFDFLSLVATPASLVYGLAADVVAPLFNRNAITASYFANNARQWKAVFSYERAILNAYTEVVNQVAMIQNLEKSYELQAEQVARLAQSIDISSQLFASARADYMEVLLTRRDALESQMDLIENKRRQMTAAVALYQALGGGWR